MARKPEDLRKRIAQPRTLAEMLLYLPDPARRVELEKYRIEYEALFGETDLTKRYTLTWPEEQQDWLMKHDMKRYFDGLPPFAKAFFKAKMETAARNGCLDDKPDEFIELYVARQMKLDHDVRHR